MTRKQRKVVNYHKELKVGNSTTPRQLNLDGYQVTDSVNHPIWKEYIQAGRDVGGTFYSYTPKFEVLECWEGSAPQSGLGSTTYQGTLLAEDPYNKFEGPANHYFNVNDRNYMLIKGATAVSRCIPTNPLVDASVTLGELRMAGLPAVPGKAIFDNKGKDPRKLGSEFLNVEFGLKPIVSDIKAFSSAVMKSERIIKDMENGAGRRYRRNYRFPKETSETKTVQVGNVYPFPAMSTANYLGGNSWTKTTTTTVTKQVWFSGAFTYHFPKGTSPSAELQRMARKAKKLYGVRLTPDVIWNLSPWSWAADWVANMGDNLNTLGACMSDGLVMPYGYVMYTQTKVVLVELSGPGTNDGKGKYFAQRYTHVDKQRVKATPFGFGLNTDNFTSRQWAIIGALGIANAPGRRVFS